MFAARFYPGRFFPRRYFPAVGAVITFVLPYETCAGLWGAPSTADAAPVACETIAAGATLVACLSPEGAASAESAPVASFGDA